MTPALSWNLPSDLAQLFEFPFMVNAYLAGTIVAATGALAGWFMVLRRQAFAGHTLAVVGFPGASAAILLGLPAVLGFFGFSFGAACIIAAAGRARSGGRGRESAAIGVVQAFALACGFLFVNLYRGNIQSVSALLFGSFLGVTARDIVLLAVVGAAVCLVLAGIGRRLVFASIDPDVAGASGLPIGRLDAAFLLLLGGAAAETSQITGSLLVFTLLVMPAAAAQTLTARPKASLALSVALALGVVWLGLAIAYYSSYPIGFLVALLAFAAYLLASLPRLLGGRVPVSLGRKEAAL